MNCFIADDLCTYMWFVFLYWPFVIFIIVRCSLVFRKWYNVCCFLFRSSPRTPLTSNQIKPTINNNYILYVIFCETAMHSECDSSEANTYTLKWRKISFNLSIAFEWKFIHVNRGRKETVPSYRNTHSIAHTQNYIQGTH